MVWLIPLDVKCVSGRFWCGFTKVAKNRCLMSRRKRKFAPAHEFSLEELMPNCHELEQLTVDARIDPEAFAIRSKRGRGVLLCKA